MTQPMWIKEAAALAISRVRFEGAYFNEGTEEVRRITKGFVESWIVPILRSIRDRDSETARCYLEGEEKYINHGMEDGKNQKSYYESPRIISSTPL